METTPHSEVNRRCIECGYALEQHTIAEPRQGKHPMPGSLSVCFGCGHITIFDSELKLREPTPEELILVELDPFVCKVQQEIRKFRMDNPHTAPDDDDDANLQS